MKEKSRFIAEWKSGRYTVSELCEYYGISRTTGHELICRYKEEGEDCFLSRSKRPQRSPNKTPEKIEKAIVRLRKKYKNWGARKLMVLLEGEFSKTEIPSETTINTIMSRHGLVKKRKRRRPSLERLNPKYESSQCNEIWSADYKGKFRLGNKRYCYPLTITDKYSRYIIDITGHYTASYESVRRAYIQAFRKYGLPQYIHTDNGLPFGCVASVGRYTKLSYWLIDQGILSLYSDPGCPQQNGKHERMHKDLKAHCTKPPRNTLSAQQRLLDEFRYLYNEVRPHESLGMSTPHSRYTRSEREYQERKQPYYYDSHLKALKVMTNGALRWGHHDWIYISTAAIGRYLGLEEIGNGIWKVYYREVFLGYFDEKEITNRKEYSKLKIKLV